MCSLAWPWSAPRSVDKHMLKITKETENTKLVRVKLHGIFTGEYASEVEKALSENGHKGNKVALDLSNVAFVDRAATEGLKRMSSARTEAKSDFRANGSAG